MCLDGQENMMVNKGLVHPECDIFFAYLAVMMIGLFLGNLFFMVTMMIVLRYST